MDKTYHSILDPWPSWLIKATRMGLAGWVRRMENASLKVGVMLLMLMDTVIRSVFFLRGNTRP